MNQEPNDRPADRPAILVLCNDLFFAMRIRNAVHSLGYRAHIVKSEPEFVTAASADHPALGVIDFNHSIDWDSLSSALADSAMPTIAFGPHKDTAGFAAARQAGVKRVIANGAFTSSLPDLVEKYASTQGDI